ncbi:MAG: asparagine synthase (glutamine-hydrolyzing) [Bacteroidetes bacterium]|nr:asparagine synthase (glutamine-hydrolyzing) [Bacteroidota bacterium]
MCGIAGIVSLNKNTQGLNKFIEQLSVTIKHRGPDDEGYTLFNNNQFQCFGGITTPSNCWNNSFDYAPQNNITSHNFESYIALAHRRLSIIDLSPLGHQPMCIDNGNIWITYNGELYNYIEIKEELQKLGHQFISTSDTEVILFAYKQWGKECLQKFNGMWAFVIYDKNKNELFGARDRFGVKPLYYSISSDYFLFASELKALAKSDLVDTKINTDAAFQFLVKTTTENTEESFFKNCFELFPSHAFTLSIDTKEFAKWQFYQLKFNSEFENYSENKFSEYSTKTAKLVEQAIKIRLRSDVAVGACLSGGIDSSSIVSIVHQLKKEGKDTTDFKVFTASFKDKEIDESNYAKLLVDKYHLNWHQVFPNAQELTTDLEDLIYSQDIPIWSTSTYAQHRVLKLASENNIKVILDGQGSDELFGGYDTYLFFYFDELIKRGRLKDFFNQVNKSSLSKPLLFYIKQKLRFSTIPKLSPDAQLKFLLFYFNDLKYLNKDFLYAHKHLLKENNTPTTLNENLHNEFYNTRLKTYLKCEDRCAMWHSVESRTPFADDINLIEYIFSIPGNYKIVNGNLKALIKDAMQNHVPQQILNRTDKKGFTTPNNKWINEIKNDIKHYFENPLLKEFINIELLQKEYNILFSEKKNTDNGRLFKFISFAVWAKKYFSTVK